MTLPDPYELLARLYATFSEPWSAPFRIIVAFAGGFTLGVLLRNGGSVL